MFLFFLQIFISGRLYGFLSLAPVKVIFIFDLLISIFPFIYAYRLKENLNALTIKKNEKTQEEDEYYRVLNWAIKEAILPFFWFIPCLYFCNYLLLRGITPRD